MARWIIPLSGKKNYFWSIDHWNSSYQPKAITNDHVKELEEMAYSDKNGWCGLPCWRQCNEWFFCLSSEMDRTHGRTTFEDDPEQQLLREQPMGNWHNGGASWEQNATVGKVPTIMSAWDLDLIGDRILQTQHVWKRKFATQTDETELRDSWEWTTIASSKTWAGSATHLWTHCPRQAWPRGSLIIKHYRVQVRTHHQGFQSLYALYTSFP